MVKMDQKRIERDSTEKLKLSEGESRAPEACRIAACSRAQEPLASASRRGHRVNSSRPSQWLKGQDKIGRKG
jgi:hypothetical protein